MSCALLALAACGGGGGGAGSIQSPSITAEFASPPQAAQEGSAVSVQLQLSQPLNADAALPLQVSGTASSADYQLDPVVVRAGETLTSVQIRIEDDSVDEPTETLVLGLTGTDTIAVGPVGSYELQLEDNDAPPTVRLVLEVSELARRTRGLPHSRPPVGTL